MPPRRQFEQSADQGGRCLCRTGTNTGRNACATRYDEAVDIERTIQFILDQQAKFFAGMEEMRRHDEEMRQCQDKFDQQLSALGKQMSDFAEQQRHINMSLGKAMLGLTEHIDRLTAAQAATDERLNALVGVVDGMIRRPPAG